MKILLALLVVVSAQAATASTLSCRNRETRILAEFDGRAKQLNAVRVLKNNQRLFFQVGSYDPDYNPRNKERDMVRYNLMSGPRLRSGASLLLPRAKGRDEFHGILVGLEHEYHGEAVYEHLTCELTY